MLGSLLVSKRLKLPPSSRPNGGRGTDAATGRAGTRYRYVIDGDSPPWRPVNAYDDGRVYIESSSGIEQGEMPPLFVNGQDGKPELVDYRDYKNVLIVDRLFAAAELRLGGEKQQKVRIARVEGRRS